MQSGELGEAILFQIIGVLDAGERVGRLLREPETADEPHTGTERHGRRPGRLVRGKPVGDVTVRIDPVFLAETKTLTPPRHLGGGGEAQAQPEFGVGRIHEPLALRTGTLAVFLRVLVQILRHRLHTLALGFSLRKIEFEIT